VTHSCPRDQPRPRAAGAPASKAPGSTSRSLVGTPFSATDTMQTQPTELDRRPLRSRRWPVVQRVAAAKARSKEAGRATRPEEMGVARPNTRPRRVRLGRDLGNSIEPGFNWAAAIRGARERPRGRSGSGPPTPTTNHAQPGQGHGGGRWERNDRGIVDELPEPGLLIPAGFDRFPTTRIVEPSVQTSFATEER